MLFRSQMDIIKDISIQSLAHAIDLAMTKDQFGAIDWKTIVDIVNQWARENVPEQYNYNSRATYWGSALTAGLITEEVYDYASDKYGRLWDYVGD